MPLLSNIKTSIKTRFPRLSASLVKIIPAPQRNRGVFASYADALAACDTKLGYDTDFLSKYLVRKTKVAIGNLAADGANYIPDHLLQTLFVTKLASEGADKINVVDFGGGCGYPFAVMSRLTPETKNVFWTIVEIPSLVSLAKDEIFIENLAFSNSLEAVKSNSGKIDLLHTACTLQYVDDPRMWLNRLVGCKAELLFFGRAGFAGGDTDFTTIQRSRIKDHGLSVPEIENPEGFVEYPATFMSKSYFDDFLSANNYEKILEFGTSSVFKPKNGPPILEGSFLFRLKKNP